MVNSSNWKSESAAPLAPVRLAPARLMRGLTARASPPSTPAHRKLRRFIERVSRRCFRAIVYGLSSRGKRFGNGGPSIAQRGREINMKVFKLCLLGFGNVGRALASLLVEKREEMRAQFRVEWRVTGIASRRLGWLVAPEGFSDDE